MHSASAFESMRCPQIYIYLTLNEVLSYGNFIATTKSEGE